MANQIAVITLYNHTSSNFTNSTIHIEHGLLQHSPPEIIAKDTSGKFEVHSISNAQEGIKGQVSYTLENNIEVYINWDLPVSGATSTYTCYSIPADTIKATLSPNSPSGNFQIISIMVEDN